MELWTRPTLGLESFLVGKKGKSCSGINNILTRVSGQLQPHVNNSHYCCFCAEPEICPAHTSQAMVTIDGLHSTGDASSPLQEKLLLDIDRNKSHESVSLF